jgi:hypothetical protein
VWAIFRESLRCGPRVEKESAGGFEKKKKIKKKLNITLSRRKAEYYD